MDKIRNKENILDFVYSDMFVATYAAAIDNKAELIKAYLGANGKRM